MLNVTEGRGMQHVVLNGIALLTPSLHSLIAARSARQRRGVSMHARAATREPTAATQAETRLRRYSCSPFSSQWGEAAAATSRDVTWAAGSLGCGSFENPQQLARNGYVRLRTAAGGQAMGKVACRGVAEEQRRLTCSCSVR